MCLSRTAGRAGVRHTARDGHRLLWARTPGHHRCEFAHIEGDLAIELGTLVTAERAPLLERLVPHRPERGAVSTLQILEGLLVRSDEPGHRRELRCHIAQRQSCLDLERANRTARKFDRIAVTADGAVLANQDQRHVLGGDPWGQHTLEVHPQGARSGHAQGPGSEGVLRLGRADAPREGAQSPLGAGVTVWADDRGARQHDAELRRDHMDDALQRIANIEQAYPGLTRGLPGFEDELRTPWHQGRIAPPRQGVDDVIHGTEHPTGVEQGPPAVAQALQGHRPRPLVQEDAIDRDQGHAAAEVADHMRIPKVVE